jgi:gas vesicle structural protein
MTSPGLDKNFLTLAMKSIRVGKYLSKYNRSFFMAVEKVNSSSSLAEVVDRILDKGVVIDAWVRVSLVGIELLAIEARVVIASVETYLKYAEAVGLTTSAAVPAA